MKMCPTHKRPVDCVLNLEGCVLSEGTLEVALAQIIDSDSPRIVEHPIRCCHIDEAATENCMGLSDIRLVLYIALRLASHDIFASQSFVGDNGGVSKTINHM